MLSCIKGGQGSGKSYYCCMCMIEDLKNMKKGKYRPIVTNIPINPDRIVDLVAKTPIHGDNLLSKITVFIDFSSFSELKKFRRRNPIYWLLAVGFKEPVFETNVIGEKILVGHQRKDCRILSDKKVCEFWNYAPVNSIIYIDEAYEHLGSDTYMNNKNKSEKEAIENRRTEMRSYVRQHRHKMHDIFMISHSTQDFDIHIKRGVMRTIHVVNSKYENMISSKSKLACFFPAKWPVQFFIIRTYRGFYDGDEDLHNSKGVEEKKFILPERKIFRCYDSFSNTSNLSGADHGIEDDMQSSDTEQPSFTKQLFKVLASCKYLIIFIISLCVGAYFIYLSWLDLVRPSDKGINLRDYQALILAKNKKKQESLAGQGVKSVKDNKPLFNKPVIDSTPKPLLPKPQLTYKVCFRSSDRIVWSDGFELNKGEITKLGLCHAINTHSITFIKNGTFNTISYNEYRDM